jgi:hypothetical protein
LATESLEYVRKLYENQLKWYSDAEARAQAVLTLDGAFLAVLTGVLIAKSEDVEKVKVVFGKTHGSPLRSLDLGSSPRSRAPCSVYERGRNKEPSREAIETCRRGP